MELFSTEYHASTWIQLTHMFNANDSDSGNLHYDFWMNLNYMDSFLKKWRGKKIVQLDLPIIDHSEQTGLKIYVTELQILVHKVSTTGR